MKNLTKKVMKGLARIVGLGRDYQTTKNKTLKELSRENYHLESEVEDKRAFLLHNINKLDFHPYDESYFLSPLKKIIASQRYKAFIKSSDLELKKNKYEISNSDDLDKLVSEIDKKRLDLAEEIMSTPVRSGRCYLRSDDCLKSDARSKFEEVYDLFFYKNKIQSKFQIDSTVYGKLKQKEHPEKVLDAYLNFEKGFNSYCEAENNPYENYNFFVINKTLEASEMLLYSENSTDLIKEKIRKIIDTISRNTPWNYRDTCRAIKEKLNEN
tara:strand:+ start:2846 stop:3652 length:807 start_codon:yes stop_codon:yes gene_type:complete